MDNSTFEMMEAEGAIELEIYRFSFLKYLAVLREMLDLLEHAEEVGVIQEIIEDGWRRDDPITVEFQERAMAEAETFLYDRYNLEHSMKGLVVAVRQFNIELSVLADLERPLWEYLEIAVYHADFADEGTEEKWFSDDEVEQWRLFFDDELAIERVTHYQKELQKTEEKPLSPNLLETVFRAHRNGLMYLTPFSL